MRSTLNRAGCGGACFASLGVAFITAFSGACLTAFLVGSLTEVVVAFDKLPKEGKSSFSIQGGCADCPLLHASGSEYQTPPRVVASPEGTTYSVHHRLGAQFQSGSQCFFVFNQALPGAPDDVVTFDGVLESTRTDFFGTVPAITENEFPQAAGNRLIVIDTASLNGADLFPTGISFEGTPLTDACFAIGLDDPLDWLGMDNVSLAEITFRKDGADFMGPFDVLPLFTSPWNGVIELRLPNGAGLGIDGVRLELRIHKTVDVPNDLCADRTPVTDGLTAFSTLGALTDGTDHGATCRESLYSQIDADIWYSYTATCTGTLTVDLCNSDYDTRLAVYSGCDVCPPTQDPLDCDDDASCGVTSLVSVPVTQGNCYLIRIGGYQQQQGDGVMSVQCQLAPPTGACCSNSLQCIGTLTASQCAAQGGVWHEGEACPAFSCPAPANDDCEDCIRLLTGVPFSEGTTIGATGDFVSSCGDDTDLFDVWHCWTADCTGEVSVETCNSVLDTTLSMYSSCESDELLCDDDQCFPKQSKLTFIAESGTTYYIRVAGWGGARGDYQIVVSQCREACCHSTGCFMVPRSTCTAGGGVPLGEGTVCARQDLNGNGVDDACDALCPTSNIAVAIPPDGTVDARMPHAIENDSPRLGLGAPGAMGVPAQPIQVLLSPQLAGVESCFEVCETVVDPIFGDLVAPPPSFIGGGLYSFVFNRAITAGGVTTIKYRGGAGTFVDFIRHPGNVNADGQSDFFDVLQLRDCCLRGQCTPPYGDYSCDIDHSTRRTPLDLLAEIDVLNGAGTIAAWNNTAKPANTSCP